MKGRVAEAAGRYVNGAQDCAGVRDFGKRRQGIRQVVKIVCKETEIRVKKEMPVHRSQISECCKILVVRGIEVF